MLIVRNITRDRLLGEGIREAGTFFSRLKGLLGCPGLSPGEGLYIHPCNGIHSFGMRFEFDALFLDRDSRVVGLCERFPKNRVSKLFPGARAVLELPAGTIGGSRTEVGDEIEIRG